MARIICDGFDFSQFDELADSTQEIMHKALYEGAKVLADTVDAYIDRIPQECYFNDTVAEKERQGLHNGLGVARHQTDGGEIYTIIDFAGYNEARLKSFPDGEPNRLVARAIAKGTSTRRQKYDFLGKAVNHCKTKCEETMNDIINDEITKILNN